MNLNRLNTLAALMLLSLPVFSQGFEKKYGGTGADKAYSVAVPSGGGYVIAGETGSFNSQGKDVLLIRTDNNGVMMWSKKYGGSLDEIVYEVQAVSDGYVMCGQTQSFGAGGIDMYVFKVDTSGNLLWSKTFGGSSDDDAKSIRQTSDGGYIVAGYTRSLGQNANMDGYLVKLDQSGNLQWSKAFGFSSNDWCVSVTQTSDGGYVATGSANGAGAGLHDLYLAKFSASGNLSWYKAYGGTGNDGSGCVRETSDGGYVVAGHTRSFGVNPPALDMLLMKVDSLGVVQWAKTIGGVGDDVLNSVMENSDGSFTCLGSSNSYGQAFSMVMLKSSSSGVLQWTKLTQETSPNYHYYSSRGLVQMPNMEYAGVGHSNINSAGSEDFYITRGSFENSCMLDTVPTVDSPGIIENSLTPAVNSATASGSAATNEASVTPVMTVVCNDVGINEMQADASFTIYPNPSKDVVVVTFDGEADLELINSLSQVVVEKGRYRVNGTATVAVKGLAKGVYFLRLTAGNRSFTKPIVIE